MYTLSKKKLGKNYELSHIPVYVRILATTVVSYMIYLSLAKMSFSVHMDNANETQDPKVSFIKDFQRIILPILDDVPPTWLPVFNKYPIVPNYVHYLRLNEPEFTFLEAVSLLSAYKNHVPMKIYVHTKNSTLSGPHWDKVLQTVGLQLILEVIPVEVPKNVPGRKNELNFLKLQILSQFGGIVLDNDLFVVNNLDKYLRHEMTLQKGNDKKSVMDQIIIARNGSRFLSLWLEAYHLELGAPNAKFESLKHVTKLVATHPGWVNVEKAHFNTWASVDRIYNKTAWYRWWGFDVVWLKKDFLGRERTEELVEFINQHEWKKKHLDVDEEAAEEPVETNFFRMIRGIY